MGNNDITGNALEIPEGLLKNLEEIDNKINKIATDSSNMGKLFSSSMGTMTTGSNALLEKLQSIKGIVGSLGTINTSGVDNISKGMKKSATEAEKAASNITKVAVAINKMNNKTYNPNSSILAWQGLQKNVEIVSKRQEALTRITKDYEKILSNIKEGKGGVITRENREQYQSAIKELEANRLLISSYREKQQAIIAYQQEQRRQIDNEEQLKKLAISDGAIGGRKKDEELKKLNDHFRQLEKEWNERTKRNKKRAEEEARAEEKKAERVSRANDKEAKSREKLRQAEERRINTKAIDAYNRAMASSEATISQRINKLARLKQAEEMLVKTNKNYTNELKRIKEETERLNTLNKTQADSFEKVRKSQSHLMDTSGQLSRKLALIFSVSQIQGYIMNVVRVTGEFEKQNVALASILQNKDKADKLFNQITELAVKSPFQLKELVTYTKQLSAYQVEYDKLYDTTKRLADVSAGLGVDMQRLILAFGQVKAANFLRGTEVRQFTEAGLNILGELAKYYSELEGRMISVGEVQEMVTKRMVKFGDVEEVFRRITSAGGIFYNMQEKQAETIAGQMSNLQDNIDIMLNSIGTANQTTIRNMIRQLNDLLKNWREVAWYIEKAVYVLGAWKTLSIITSLGNTGLAHSLFRVKEMSEASTKSLNFLGKSLKKLYAFGRGFAIGGAALLLGWLVDMYRESTKTRRELELLENTLDNLTFGDTAQLEKEISVFEDLIARYKLANEGTQARRDLISSLNSNYGEYLNFLVDEKTSVEDLETAYDDVVKKMREKSALQTLEKGYQEINKFYSDNIEDAKEKFSDSLIVKVGTKELEASSKDIENILKITQNKVRELETEDMDNWQKRGEIMKNIVQEYFGEQAEILKADSYLIDLMFERKEKEIALQDKVNDSYKETMKSREANLAFEKREIAFEKEKRDIYTNFKGSKFEVNEKIKEAATKFELDKIDIKLEFGEISEESAKKAKDRIINWGTELTKSFNDKVRDSLEGLSSEDISKILISPEDQASGISSIIKSTTEGWESQNAIIEQQIRLKNQGLVVDEDLLARSIKMEELYRKRADFLGIELKYVQKIGKTELESINAQMKEDYRLDLVDSLKSTMQLQDKYNKKYEEAVKIQESMIAQKLLGVAIDEKDLALWTERVEQYDKLRKLLGFVEKTKAGGRKPKSELKKLKEQIALIKKAGQEYKKLQKYYSDDKAKQKVQDSFKDAFKEVGLSIDMDFDTQGIIDGIEHISNNAGEEGRKAIKEATSDLKAEVDIEFRQDKIRAMKSEIEDLFSSYEISMEIDKTGLDKDVVSNMFHIDVMSLGDLKGKLNKMRDMYVNQGDELRKVWEDAMKKISEIEDRELKSRLERFSDYLSDYLDKIESVKAKAALDIHYADTIFNSNGVDAEQYTQIIKNIVDSTNEEISKLNTEKFKESPEYIKAMGDLSAYSAKELEQMLQKMKELVASSSNAVSASDLKVYQDAITKITAQLKKVKMPWEKNEIADFKEMNRLQKEYEDEIENQNRLLEEQKMKLNELKEAKANLAAMQQQKQKEGDSSVVNRQIEQQQGYIQNLTKDLGGIQNKLNLSQSNISNISGKMGGMAGGAGKALAQVDKIVKLVYNSINSTIELFNEFKSLADSFGKDTTKGKWGMWSEGMKAMGEMNNKVMGSWESFKKGDMMGASVKAVGAVFSVIKGINAIGDKKKENQIQKHIERVEDLTYAYEKLKEATERAYDVNELRKGTEQMNNNLAARNKALQASIKAEEDKKKTDRERIKEWQKEIDANNKMILENKKQLLAELGGFGTDSNIKSAAEEFASSWLDAFLETGNGLDGLQAKMDDWLKNAIQKQLLVNLSKEFISPLLKSFDDMFKDGSLGGANMMPEEAAAWKDLYESKSEEFNKRAEAYLEALKAAGIELPSKGEEGDKLSGLSRSITSVSEATAQSLEAITESIRFFSADSNAQLKLIAASIATPNVENPFLIELKNQTEQMRVMVSIWNSLTMTKVGVNGKCLKVNII